MKQRSKAYFFQARLFPAVLSALPVILLGYFLSGNIQFKELLHFLASVKFFGSVGLVYIALYFYALVIRTISKVLQKKYFGQRPGWPTTYLMIYSDETYTKSFKDSYRSKVRNRFNLKLLSEKEEVEDPAEARKLLAETAQLVVSDLGDAGLVLHHNIWYGFWRNLLGGTVLSMLFCIANVFIGALALRNSLLVVISAVLFVLYLAVFIFRKHILIENAEEYAKKLFAEFMLRA